MDPRQARGSHILSPRWGKVYSILHASWLHNRTSLDGSIFDNSKARRPRWDEVIHGNDKTTRHLLYQKLEGGNFLGSVILDGFVRGKRSGNKPLPLSHQRLVSGVWTSAGFPLPVMSIRLPSKETLSCFSMSLAVVTAHNAQNSTYQDDRSSRPENPSRWELLVGKLRIRQPR